jgi:predicted metal-binding protein
LRAIAATAPPPDGLRLVAAECLGGCPLPCAAAFNAPDKWRVRFTRLSERHLPDLLAAARVYVVSADGYLTDALLPPGLRGHISARSPTRPVRPAALPAIQP